MILKLQMILILKWYGWYLAYKNAIQRKNKKLSGFDDMIADMLSNKKLNPIATDLFIRERKLNIFLVFITQSYFVVPKNIRLNSTQFFIVKISNKQELQQIAFNHSSDIYFRYFMNLHKKYTVNRYTFLVIGATFVSDNS